MGKRRIMAAGTATVIAVIAAVLVIGIRADRSSQAGDANTALVLLSVGRGGPLPADIPVDTTVDVYTDSPDSSVRIDSIRLIVDGDPVGDATPTLRDDRATATITWTPAVPRTHVVEAVASLEGGEARSEQVGVRVVPATTGRPTGSAAADEDDGPESTSRSVTPTLATEGSPPGTDGPSGYPSTSPLPSDIGPTQPTGSPPTVELISTGPIAQGKAPEGQNAEPPEKQQPQPNGSVVLVGAQLTIDSPASQVYCYISVDGGPHTRVPTAPGEFLEALDAERTVWDIGSALGALGLDDQAQASLELDCWGWRDGEVTQLGTLTTQIGKPLPGLDISEHGVAISLGAIQIALDEKKPIFDVKPPPADEDVPPTPQDIIPAPYSFSMTPKLFDPQHGVEMTWTWKPKVLFPGDPPPGWINDIDGIRFIGFDGKTVHQWPATPVPGGGIAVVDADNGIYVSGLLEKPNAFCGWMEAYKGGTTSERSNIACWPGMLPETKTGPEIVMGPSSIFEIKTKADCEKYTSPESNIVVSALCGLAVKVGLPMVAWSPDPFGCTPPDEKTTPDCPYRTPDSYHVYRIDGSVPVEVGRTTNHPDQRALILSDSEWGSCIEIRGAYKDMVSTPSDKLCLPAKPPGYPVINPDGTKTVAPTMIKRYFYGKTHYDYAQGSLCPEKGAANSDLRSLQSWSVPAMQSFVGSSVDASGLVCETYRGETPVPCSSTTCPPYRRTRPSSKPNGSSASPSMT